MVQPAENSWPAPYAEGLSSPGFAPLLINVPMALALIDSSGRMFAGNEAMVATAGDAWRPGLKPQDMAVPDSAAQLARAVAAVVAGGAARSLRVALVNRPNEAQDLRLLPFPPGLGAAAMIALRDIREQLRLEAQVAAATRMQAVGQLAGGVAHDFNNLLTAVLALTDQVLETDLQGSNRDAVQEIRRNGERGAKLVGQLLAFARQQPQRRNLLSVRALLNGLQPLLVQLLGPAVELVIPPGNDQLAVAADPGQLEQVIVNLAVNARDAMNSNGRLVISITDVPGSDIPALGHAIMPAVDHVAIDVTDSGSGIPPQILGKIFEPFFTTKPQGQGTGLGLSTVYGIIKQSDGFIFAKPGPGGRGTTFTVYLPARTLPSTASAGPPAVSAGPPAPAQARPALTAGCRVLLVEDEPAVRTVFARGLERQGCAVTTAEDAMTALTILRGEQSFDVLVSDVMMPGIDGVELAVEAARMRPGLGIVLMSGYAELPRQQAANELGFRFLAKPFALAELLDAIAVTQALPA